MYACTYKFNFSRTLIFGVIFYMKLLWTLDQNGRNGKFYLNYGVQVLRSMASVAQRKWTRPKTMRPRVRIPVKNFESWKCVFQLEKQFPIVFIALRGPEPALTPSLDICERHMLVTWYQNGWRSNHNVGLRMLLVVGAGGGTYNSWNSHKRFKRYKIVKSSNTKGP